MAEEIWVQIARPADAGALGELNPPMAWETERKALALDIVRAGVNGLLCNPTQGFYVVAEAGGELAGSLMITFEWSDWRNAIYWWIQSVYIRPEFRRQGVYRRLYDFVK